MAGCDVSTRFASPLSPLDPPALLRRSRRTLWRSLFAAAVLHTVFVALNPFRESLHKAPRPLTNKFIKREPRLTKPLELRKIPAPKRKLVRRDVRPLPVARMDQVQATASFNTGIIVSQTANPRVHFARAQRGPGPAADLSAMSHLALAGSRVPENKIDMGLQMLDIGSMDTGRYRAMVVQDPVDKQSLQGFVKLAQVHSARATELGKGQRDLRTLGFLREALNDYTGVRADLLGDITYDDSRLMEVPIIYPAGDPNESEMENLARYLIGGGFILGELTRPMEEGLIKYGGLVRGRDFWTENLPEGHPIFSSFFDVNTNIPSGQYSGIHMKWSGWLNTVGYFVQGRLVAVKPGQGFGFPSLQHFPGDYTRQLQMAVNIVVYALTQEGSITQRLMQMVN